MPNYLFGLSTDIGLARAGSPNQDSMAVIKPEFPNNLPPLLVVADGMGGYKGGEIASQLVVTTLRNDYFSLIGGSIRSILLKALKKVHDQVKRIGSKDIEMISMGSTVVAVSLDHKKIIGANVGDSRAYIINKSGIYQISQDHSIVAEMVRSGQMTADEAHGHTQLNRLSQAISARREKITPFIFEVEFGEKDIVLLCTDGLWGPVAESQIWRVAYELEPQAAANKLVEMANAAGGPDNITVVIARHELNLPDDEHESTGEFETN